MTTPRLVNATLVCHNEEDAERMRSDWPNHEVIVSGVPKGGLEGIANQRNWIASQTRGEWVVMLDDDIERISSPNLEEEPDFYEWKDWRAIYDQDAEKSVEEIAADIRERCIEQGTIFGGLYGTDNYYFRKKRWATGGVVVTRFAVWFNNGWNWHKTLEDVEMSCRTIAEYGSVVLDRWHFVVTPDGSTIGEDRVDGWWEAAEWLTSKYGRLVTPDYPYFRILPGNRIAKWRREHDLSSLRAEAFWQSLDRRLDPFQDGRGHDQQRDEGATREHPR